MASKPNKTALVTGAAGAFGKWISRRLHEQNWNVVLQARSQAQLDETINWITETADPKQTNATLTGLTCDLSSYADVKRFCTEYAASGRPLHALVNNAAASPTTREETRDGLEVQFHVNVFDYWLIEELLWPVLAKNGTKSDPARVVNVASYYAGGLDVDDIEFKKRKYENNAGYTQSKQANRMLTVMAAEKHPEVAQGTVWIASVMPAFSASKLTVDLGTAPRAVDDASLGAVGPVWCVVDEGVARPETAGHYVPKKGKTEPDTFTRDDRPSAERLWKLCEETKRKLDAKLGNL